MHTNKDIAQAPSHLRDISWFESIAELLEEQSKSLQEKDRLIQEQAEQIAMLKATVQELKDEIARMKKLPKRPKFRPAGGQPRSRSGLPNINNHHVVGSTAHKLLPQKARQEIKVVASEVPEGSRFKGYQDYVVQEIELIVKDVTYRLEVWKAPDGRIIRATLPGNLKGTHFGSELRALIHNLYAACMTEPEIFNFLTGFGVEISTGQIHNMLMYEVKKCCDVSKEILATGLETAPYIWTDDTSTRHEYKHGYCTHIGGEYFACFRTSLSKSRSNFLEILLQGKEGYWINEAFIRHLGQSNLNGIKEALNVFTSYLGEKYETIKEMNDVLDTVGIKNKVLRLQCVEAGLIGFISQTIMRSDQVLLSDRAGQFAILNHAACWVHMERPLRTLRATTDALEQAIKEVRGMIWDLYAKVKTASMTKPGEEATCQREEINQLYDELIATKTSSLNLKSLFKIFLRAI